MLFYTKIRERVGGTCEVKQACSVSSWYDEEPAVSVKLLNLKKISLEYVRRALALGIYHTA